MIRRCVAACFLLFALLTFAATQTDYPQEPLASLRFLVGHWSCSGKFLHSGKEISSDVVFETALEGKWLVEHHDDRPPFNYHALTEWGWDKDNKQFVATVQDSAGGQRTFYSSGWDGNRFIWETKLVSPAQRFAYTKNGDKRIQIDYAVNKSGTWDTIDTLACSLQ